MEFDTYSYRVGTHYLPAIFNGDTSGLVGWEVESLNGLLDNLPGDSVGHWSYDSDNGTSFARCEISRHLDDCADIEYMVPVE